MKLAFFVYICVHLWFFFCAILCRDFGGSCCAVQKGISDSGSDCLLSMDSKVRSKHVNGRAGGRGTGLFVRPSSPRLFPATGAAYVRMWRPSPLVEDWLAHTPASRPGAAAGSVPQPPNRPSPRGGPPAVSVSRPVLLRLLFSPFPQPACEKPRGTRRGPGNGRSGEG